MSLVKTALAVALLTLWRSVGWASPTSIKIPDPVAKNRPAATLYRPSKSDSFQRPLVILLHGAPSTGGLEDWYFGLSALVESRDFSLLIPEGTKNSWGLQFWNATDSCCDDERSGVDDVRYLFRLLERVARDYGYDPSRVYLVGHSAGGFMANRLACEAGGKFAAIATLAGGTFKDPRRCKDQAPVSYLQIHAENDGQVPYVGDASTAGGVETVRQWVRRNQCQLETPQGRRMDLVSSIRGADSTEKIYGECQSGTEVRLWTIQRAEGLFYLPHVPDWQKGAVSQILDFFFAHRIHN